MTSEQQRAANLHSSFPISALSKQPLPGGPSINPFKVAYINDSTRVTVEGINWGANSHVMLYAVSPAPDTPAGVPLWALVELRAPDEGEAPVGQVAQLGRDAGLLRRYASDVQRGDFSAFPAALRIVEGQAATLAKPKTIRLP